MIKALYAHGTYPPSGTPQDFDDVRAAGIKQIAYVYSLDCYIG